MVNKNSLRFFEDIPVRAVWDEESAKWWLRYGHCRSADEIQKSEKIWEITSRKL